MSQFEIRDCPVQFRQTSGPRLPVMVQGPRELVAWPLAVRPLAGQGQGVPPPAGLTAAGGGQPAVACRGRVTGSTRRSSPTG